MTDFFSHPQFLKPIIVENFLSESELKLLLSLAKTISPAAGTMFTPHFGTVIDQSTKKNSVFWAHNQRETKSIMDKFTAELSCHHIFNHLNFEVDSLQLSFYRPGDYYLEHVDHNSSNVTLVLFLSLVEDWSGGELEIKLENETLSLKPTHNTLVIFKSEWAHQVKPIVGIGEAYCRLSIQAWPVQIGKVTSKLKGDLVKSGRLSIQQILNRYFKKESLSEVDLETMMIYLNTDMPMALVFLHNHFSGQVLNLEKINLSLNQEQQIVKVEGDGCCLMHDFSSKEPLTAVEIYGSKCSLAFDQSTNQILDILKKQKKSHT